MEIKMLKKLVWKLFPPKYVSMEQVEQAHLSFENARRDVYSNPFCHKCDVDDAKKNFHDTVKRRLEYEEYVKLQEMA